VTVLDATNWLVTTKRAIGEYVQGVLDADSRFAGFTSVEMSFPDTSNWTKTTPLDRVIVHFEIDDEQEPTLGFGIPGVGTFDSLAGTESFAEAVRHLVNFDVGVWVSAEMGGDTKRMEVRQALKDIFATQTGREAFRVATEGVRAVSFDGGSDVLDRVNDVPLWRTHSMTLVVEVYSKHVQQPSVTVPLVSDQHQELTIDDGQHVVTNDEPWT